ncbi:MAG TPA: tetratricopeptide repeat protein [Chthoniobacterales bacterium]|nr:tetratricopeptide repeat protein [Chthoniobacterales bacterium]
MISRHNDDVALPDPSADRAPSRSAALKQFFVELKRRKVYRVAVAYVVVAWVLIQVATQVFPFFEIPNWIVRLVVLALIVGFPVALVLSWAYDITPSGIKRTEDTAPAPVASIPEKSIAVLPFENLSDDRENTFFADGVHDDVLSSLARIADLKVISRTSVQQYRTGARNLREVGLALGVAHILEGTVRRAGNRVRVNVQLINACTDAHIWAESYDRELTDLFAIQSELAERIVGALRANLSPREKAGLQVPPTTSLEAYDIYLRARDLFRWSGIGDPRENGEKALPLLEQALARDPQFALAHYLTSRIHGELFWFGYDKSWERLAKSKAAAETALRLRPEMGEGHLALAFYHYYSARDYEAAIRELTLAQRALPNEADVASALGMIERRRGRWPESLLHLERARQLDPRNISALWNLSETLTYLRRYAEADRVLEEIASIAPEAHLIPVARAELSLRERGDTTPLREALGRVPQEFDPGGAITTIAVRLALMERDYDEAERRLGTCTECKYNDVGLCGFVGALDDYTVPRDWYVGLIARGHGKEDEAARAFAAAKEAVLAEAVESPNDPKVLIMRALIDTMLGRAEEAIATGERAVQLLPISADALDGPLLATNLAAIYAQLGRREQALAALETLVRQTGGPTPGTLRVEPEWDPLRGDPRFQGLLTSG